jgi:hypothetical protein
MADPIEAHYTPDGDDWSVAVTGRGRTLTGRAPGLIAARDRADQLVEQLAPQETGHKTVVHMLNGDAVEFTTAYLTARLTRSEDPAPQEPEAPVPGAEPADDTAPEAKESTGEEESGEAAPAKTAPADGEAAASEDPAASQQAPANQEAPVNREAPANQEAPTPANAANANREAPPAANADAGGQSAAVKPTPFPRTESEAAKPAVQPPTAEAPKEESATSGS